MTEQFRNYRTKIIERQKNHTDISDHLLTLFKQAVEVSPKLIVELGVRGGESSFSFNLASKLTGSYLLGIDLDDCHSVYDNLENSLCKFIKGDDIQIGKDFPRLMGEIGWPLTIDLLFIDTSHYYNHTKEEIENWFPHLSPTCRVIFHDTNLQNSYYWLDGTIGTGWNNQRGVIRAIQEYLGIEFDENKVFVWSCNDWDVTHYPHCNGLTILSRE